MFYSVSFLEKYVFLSAALLLSSCIDPVSPEFQFFDGQINIEAFASTIEGASYVIVNRSSTEFGQYRNLFEQGAKVSFRNTNTDELIVLQERESDYVPPEDFVVLVGESWELNIVLASGEVLRSEPEIVIAPVAISNISNNYDAELKFDDGVKRFIPGHTISIGFEDPAEADNYYYWRFKSFEKLDICAYCPVGVFRDGTCTSTGSPHMYACETDCWRIRYNETVEIFSDEFTNGRRTENLPVAEVLLYTKEDILVRLEQFALSPKAYTYYKTLKDVIDNNSSLNAPPPAALVGNLFNVDNDEEFILGRFTATAATAFSIWIARSGVEERPLEEKLNAPFESGLEQAAITAPCVEGRFRTTNRPQDWQGD